MYILTASVIYGLSITSMILLVIWVISFTIGHIVNKDMSPLIHAVSEYGAYKGSKPFIMVCWWTMGFLSILLDACLIYILNSDPSGWNQTYLVGVICLAIFAVARILTSLFPTNVYQRPKYEEVGVPRDDPNNQNMNNSLHRLFAFLSFVSIVIATINIGKSLGNEYWDGNRLYENHLALYGLGWACLGTLLPMMLARRVKVVRYYFGFLERLFYLAHVTFLFTLAATFIEFAEEI